MNQIINNLQNQYIHTYQQDTFIYFDIQQFQQLEKLKYCLYDIHNNQLTKKKITIIGTTGTNDFITIKFKLFSCQTYFFNFTLYYTDKTITLFSNYTSPAFSNNIDITIIKNKNIVMEESDEEEESNEEEESDNEEEIEIELVVEVDLI